MAISLFLLELGCQFICGCSLLEAERLLLMEQAENAIESGWMGMEWKLFLMPLQP